MRFENILRMKNSFKIIIVIGIFSIFLFKDWLKPFIITSLGGFTHQKTDTIKNIEYIKGKIDTLEVFNNYVKTNGINLNPKSKIIYVPSKTEPKKIDSFKQFKVKIKDSLIDGTFTVNNKFNGNLTTSFFDYKPLFPKYILSVDTLRTTTIITKKLTNKRGRIGLGTGYDFTQNRVQLLAGYTFKNNLQLLYEYEIPLRKDMFNSFPVNELHSAKILINF